MRTKVRRKNILVRIPANLSQKVDIALMCCSALGTHLSRNKFINEAIEAQVDVIFNEMKKIREEALKEEQEEKILREQEVAKRKAAVDKIFNGRN